VQEIPDPMGLLVSKALQALPGQKETQALKASEAPRVPREFREPKGIQAYRVNPLQKLSF